MFVEQELCCLYFGINQKHVFLSTLFHLNGMWSYRLRVEKKQDLLSFGILFLAAWGMVCSLFRYFFHGSCVGVYKD